MLLLGLGLLAAEIGGYLELMFRAGLLRGAWQDRAGAGIYYHVRTWVVSRDRAFDSEAIVLCKVDPEVDLVKINAIFSAGQQPSLVVAFLPRFLRVNNVLEF